MCTEHVLGEVFESTLRVIIMLLMDLERSGSAENDFAVPVTDLIRG